MYKLMMFPVLVVMLSISYNVFYFFMSLQAGKLSHNSIIWIIAQLPCIKPAINGDLTLFFEVTNKLRSTLN